MGMLAAAIRPGAALQPPTSGAAGGLGPDLSEAMAMEQTFSFERLVPLSDGDGSEAKGEAAASKTTQEGVGDKREGSDNIAAVSTPLAPETMVELAAIGFSEDAAIGEASRLRALPEPAPLATAQPAGPAADPLARQAEARGDMAAPGAGPPIGVAAPGEGTADGSRLDRGPGRDAAALAKRRGEETTGGEAVAASDVASEQTVSTVKAVRAEDAQGTKAASDVASEQTVSTVKAVRAEDAQGTKAAPGAKAAPAAISDTSPTEPNLDARAPVEPEMGASALAQDRGGAAQPPALAVEEPAQRPSPLAKTEGGKIPLGSQELSVVPDTGGAGSSLGRDHSRQDEDRQDRQPEGGRRIEAGDKSERTASFAAASKAEAAQAPAGVTAKATAFLESPRTEGATGASPLELPAALDRGPANAPVPLSSSHAASARLSAHQQVGQQITRRLDDGSMHFDLRLDPPELGQVSVKLEVGADGAVKAAIGADTPMALAELVRGARELERTLAQAGLSVERGALTFDLHDRSRGGEDQSDRQGRQSGSGNGSGNGSAEAAAPSARPLTASLWRAARVDLIA